MPAPLHFLFERFATVPRSVALADRGRTFTYAQIQEETELFERRLMQEAIVPGDVVIVLGDYTPEIVCLLFALARNRNVLVPVTRESVIERSVIEELSEAQWVLSFVDGELRVESRTTEPSNPLLLGVREAGDPGLVLFSSGSSGTPKAILHNLRVVAEKFRRKGQPMVAIAFLMLDHFGGINTILSILSGLGTLVTVPDRSVVGICRTIEEQRVEILPTTPSFLGMLVRSDALDRFDLTSLKRITYGTEVMPQGTLDRVRKAFPGVVLQQTYGLSEVGVLRSKSRPDGSLWVNVGGDGFQTKVVDDVLWIKSEYAMVGYLNAPSLFDADGWFNTQDLVEVDGEWLRILGRDSDLINVAGQKVYPAEVEQMIIELDNITDVAVYGEPHALLGQVIVARVATVEPEAVASLKARIRSAGATQLAAYKLPTKVVLADEAELYSARLKKRRRA
jgi:acyl-CoA synthetase (AMP-forming)/AMP-acid ligase II